MAGPTLRGLLLSSLLAIFSATCFAQGVDDDYLREIEGGMEGVDTDLTSPPEAPPSAPVGETPVQSEFLDEIGLEMQGMEGTADGVGVDDVPENARAQFEADLKDRMPGTYFLYRQLAADKRDLVFDEYQVSGDYLRVRRKIIEIRKGS